MISKKLSFISNIITIIGMILAFVLYKISDTLACSIVIIGIIAIVIYTMSKKYSQDPANKYSDYSLNRQAGEHRRQDDIINSYCEFVNDLRYQGLILPVVHDTLITQGQEYINRAYAGGRLFAREHSENNELTLFELLLSEIENLYVQNSQDNEFRASLRNTHMYISTFLEQHGINIQSDIDMYASSECIPGENETVEESPKVPPEESPVTEIDSTDIGDIPDNVSIQ